MDIGKKKNHIYMHINIICYLFILFVLHLLNLYKVFPIIKLDF